MHFYNARWYDSYLNRFLSPDTIVPDQYNPLDWDRYAYARNNPVKYSDPTGHMVDESGCRTAGCSLWNQRQSLRAIEDALMKDHREWSELPEKYRDILGRAGWDQGSYSQSEFARGGVTDLSGKVPEDIGADISIIVSCAFTCPAILASAAAAITEYFCLDGNCGNEFEISSHLLERMWQRGVTIDQLQTTLQQIPFKYFHDGVWKLGYYDPLSKIFVAVVEANRVITTVITNVKPAYIENLKEVIP